MSDQSTEELQAQAQAMLNHFAQALFDANARTVTIIGEKAVSDLHLKNALARVAELEFKLSESPLAAAS